MENNCGTCRLGMLLVAICLCVPALNAQGSASSQIELNGFILGQYESAPDGQFGKATQTEKTDDGWINRAYVFDGANGAYMAFKFSPKDAKRIVSIQIAGRAGTQMIPFLGLRLGDDWNKVVNVVGKPSSIEHETDYDVDLWKYDTKNYSFEFDKEGKLSSIQIMGYRGLPDKPASAVPNIEDFRKAVLNRDTDTLMSILSGDLEVYKGDKTYTFTKSARSELTESQSEIAKLLFGEKNSVLAAIELEKFDPDLQLRLYEKASPGSVAKFEKSKILREIVFKAEAGSWKIWEITFR